METEEREERFEKSIKEHPERYTFKRNREGRLVEVIDKDSGFLWFRIGETWNWIV